MSITAAVASCSVYGLDLVGSGGAGTGGTTTSRAGMGGAGGAGGTSSTSSTSTMVVSTSNTGGATTSTTSTTTSSTTSTTSSTTSTTTSSTTSTTTSSTTSSTTTSSTTSSTSSTSSGGPNAVLWLSQVKTRGLNGGLDEWVEIYNPGSAPVTFDSTWELKARNATVGMSACATAGYGSRFMGGGQVIPPHGHILYASSAGFSESPATPADGTYPSTFGIPDAASVILVQNNAVVDALCFYYDTTTLATLGCPGNPYTCAGTPVMNPHDNTTATDVNSSLERLPGGASGNTQNTGDNATDFATATPDDPHDLASSPVP